MGQTAVEHQFVHKTVEAGAARIERLTTVFDHAAAHCRRIGNPWTRLHYGGEFCLATPDGTSPAVSLVFVQTRNGNTGGEPGTFGGGATDQHLIYEGLSRVAADGVLTGSGSLHAGSFYSVWHPEIVSLRASFGLPRHPAQIVVSGQGQFDIAVPLFNVPDVPVFVIGGDACFARHDASFRARPWIRRVPLGGGLRAAIDRLGHEFGMRTISAVGGPVTATRLVDEGVARDLYLTITSRDGGEPNTPWYSGPQRPPLTVVTRKQWFENGSRVFFEHIGVGSR